MEVIYILLPLALALATGAVVAFIRAASAGQFDDLETPAHRILHDDDDGTLPPKATSSVTRVQTDPRARGESGPSGEA